MERLSRGLAIAGQLVLGGLVLAVVVRTLEPLSRLVFWLIEGRLG